MGFHWLVNVQCREAFHVEARPPPAVAIEALAAFEGVKRRLEVRGTQADVTVYDDFAHHPTAIATTLKGMRAKVGQSKITVVLEPRSNTMKSGVHKDTLAFSMMQADEAFLYQADTIDWNMKEAMEAAVIPVTVLHQIDDVVAKVAATAKAGDTIVVMSNGGFGGLHKKLLAALEQASTVEQVS